MKPHILTYRVMFYALSCWVIVFIRCEAQQVAVQLPTFNQFGVSTTVVVPDRGSMYLGGINRSSLGRSSFGQGHFSPGLLGFGNRGFGRTSSASGLSVSATIIDHNEIDRALLAEAARRRGAPFDIHGRPVANAPRLPRDHVGQRWASGRNAQRAIMSARQVPY